MTDAAELDAVWRQTVAEFDRGLTLTRALLKRGQFANAMAAVEQCQALMGVMDALQRSARIVPLVTWVPGRADGTALTVAEIEAGEVLRSGIVPPGASRRLVAEIANRLASDG